MTRKPRPPQGPLQVLTKSQRVALAAWLRRHTYKEVVCKLREEFGIRTSETALVNWYARNVGTFPAPRQPPLPAAGIGVTIKCHRLGEMTLAVYALPPVASEASDAPGKPEPAATVRAGGVEITALQGALPGEMQLVVKPTAGPETDAANEPGGTSE